MHLLILQYIANPKSRGENRNVLNEHKNKNKQKKKKVLEAKSRSTSQTKACSSNICSELIRHFLKLINKKRFWPEGEG